MISIAYALAALVVAEMLAGAYVIGSRGVKITQCPRFAIFWVNLIVSAVLFHALVIVDCIMI